MISAFRTMICAFCISLLLLGLTGCGNDSEIPNPIPQNVPSYPTRWTAQQAFQKPDVPTTLMEHYQTEATAQGWKLEQRTVDTLRFLSTPTAIQGHNSLPCYFTSQLELTVRPATPSGSEVTMTITSQVYCIEPIGRS